MLIGFTDIQSVLASRNIPITGAFHIGAHECEELGFYNQLGLHKDDIVWIDAYRPKVIEAKIKGIPNVYNAVITDKDDEDVVFHVSNNIQSSSVLEFGTHLKEHPGVFYTSAQPQRSITIDTIFERNNIDASNIIFGILISKELNSWH